MVPSGGRGRRISEFAAGLVYRTRSRTERPVSKTFMVGCYSVTTADVFFPGGLYRLCRKGSARGVPLKDRMGFSDVNVLVETFILGV